MDLMRQLQAKEVKYPTLMKYLEKQFSGCFHTVFKRLIKKFNRLLFKQTIFNFYTTFFRRMR
jgi:hypothetical protein